MVVNCEEVIVKGVYDVYGILDLFFFIFMICIVVNILVN